MSRLMMILVAVSLGATACQKTKNGQQSSPPPAYNTAPPPRQGPPPPNYPPPPVYQQPPPPVLTDDTGGQINQPGGPPVVIIPNNPPPQQPPPNYPPPQQPPPNYPPPQQPPPNYPPPDNPPPITQQPPPQQPPPQPPPQPPQQPPVAQQPPPPTQVQPTPVQWEQPLPAPQPITQQPVEQIQPKLVNWNDPQPLPANPKPCDNCGTQVVQPVKPPVAEVCRDISKCDPPVGSQQGQCTAALRVDKKRNKLDILFVVDTSASLRRGGVRKPEDGELTQIGRGMKEFVKNLDPETDYRIGVLTGHGPASGYHGKLIGSVVSYDSVKRGHNRAQAEQEIARKLESIMKSVPNERGGAQGEALLLSLYDAITKPNLRNAIKSKGLFREDAALNVIMVSDEQDVCFDYAGTQYQPTKKTVKIKGKTEQISDPYEAKFFEKVCKRAVGGKPLTPGHVYDALRSITNGDNSRIIMNAIIYTAPVPASLQNIVEDENEMGHGIIELMQLGTGTMVPLEKVYLSKSEFGPELDLLGKAAKFRMKYNNTFACNSNFHPDSVNYTSMTARVLDGKGRQVAIFSGACNKKGCDDAVDGALQFRPKVDTRGKHSAYSEVTVDMDTLKNILEHYHVEDGQVVMEFNTSSDRNPQTGAKWTAKEMKPRKEQEAQKQEPKPETKPETKPAQPAPQQPKPTTTPSTVKTAEDSDFIMTTEH